MDNSVSFLLGAGFSAPKGYPIGNQLNKSLVECSGKNLAFHTDGTLVYSLDGSKPDFGYKNSFDNELNFCLELMKFYDRKFHGFQYEDFYDFFHNEADNDAEVSSIAEKYLTHYNSLKELLLSIDNIYAQLIQYYLKDRNGVSWHDNEGHACGPMYPGYTGILNCFKKISLNNIINIHTLNHDIFFESLNSSDWLMGKLSDGFEELGSSYYGELIISTRAYKVRLSRYTGEYENKIRLYKLHGSLDYAQFYTDKNGYGTPDNYVKLKYGVRFGDLFKELNYDGKLNYEHCFINYHADFLTGSVSKISRYNEPFFMKLFEQFKTNLINSEKLIIVGYGGKDSEINRIILEYFDYKNKPIFIVDPFPGEGILELKNKVNALLLNKHIEHLDVSDFN